MTTENKELSNPKNKLDEKYTSDQNRSWITRASGGRFFKTTSAIFLLGVLSKSHLSINAKIN